MRAAARASASLDQPVGDQDDAVFGDFVAGDDPLPEECVEGALRSQALAVALQALTERERQVLVLRYGLVDEEPKTLEQIGKRLGLTRERVRQIELDSLRRLANLREMQMMRFALGYGTPLPGERGLPAAPCCLAFGVGRAPLVRARRGRRERVRPPAKSGYAEA